jgi:fumarylacetoacetate (FAA) hydrolase
VTRSRRLRAGTIVGSGTVSNEDRAAGSACIAERRAIELIEQGAPQTAFMRFGDTVRIEMLDAAGASIFGAIDQRIVALDDARTAGAAS